MDTVLHELQHHLESQAGLDDLARMELEELAKTLVRNNNKNDPLLVEIY